MTDPEVFTPGQKVRRVASEMGREGVLVGPDTREGYGVGDRWVVCPDDADGWESWPTSGLTPVPDTVEITVSLTREQVGYAAEWWYRPATVTSFPARAVGDACRSWLASEEATK